jgi:predicted nucleic acid-binding protein
MSACATPLRDAALSAVGLTELVHGIYRAPTPELRFRREAFLNELLADLTVYPYTRETAGSHSQCSSDCRFFLW